MQALPAAPWVSSFQLAHRQAFQCGHQTVQREAGEGTGTGRRASASLTPGLPCPPRVTILSPGPHALQGALPVLSNRAGVGDEGPASPCGPPAVVVQVGQVPAGRGAPPGDLGRPWPALSRSTHLQQQGPGQLCPGRRSLTLRWRQGRPVAPLVGPSCIGEGCRPVQPAPANPLSPGTTERNQGQPRMRRVTSAPAPECPLGAALTLLLGGGGKTTGPGHWVTGSFIFKEGAAEAQESVRHTPTQGRLASSLSTVGPLRPVGLGGLLWCPPLTTAAKPGSQGSHSSEPLWRRSEEGHRPCKGNSESPGGPRAPENGARGAARPTTAGGEVAKMAGAAAEH